MTGNDMKTLHFLDSHMGIDSICMAREKASCWTAVSMVQLSKYSWSEDMAYTSG